MPPGDVLAWVQSLEVNEQQPLASDVAGTREWLGNLYAALTTRTEASA